MKLYIITVSEAVNSASYSHVPIVKLTRKEAREELRLLRKNALPEYIQVFGRDGVEATPFKSNSNSFSIQKNGCHCDYHFDAQIDAIDVPIPVYSLVSTSLNDGVIQECDSTVYTSRKRAQMAMKEFARAEARDARQSGYKKIDTEIGEQSARVLYPSGDNMQHYAWRIQKDNI